MVDGCVTYTCILLTHLLLAISTILHLQEASTVTTLNDGINTPVCGSTSSSSSQSSSTSSSSWTSSSSSSHEPESTRCSSSNEIPSSSKSKSKNFTFAQGGGQLKLSPEAQQRQLAQMDEMRRAWDDTAANGLLEGNNHEVSKGLVNGLCLGLVVCVVVSS